MVNMGDKLKSLRIQNNLTQKQVAERIGMAVSAVSAYESGTRYPSYDALIKLARIYHVSADYLLGIENKRELDVSGLSPEQIDALRVLIRTMRHNIS